MNNDQKIALTIDEAALASGLSRAYLYLLSARGELPVSKVGRKVVILRTELEAFLRARIRTGSQGTDAAPTGKVGKRLI